MMTAAIDRRKFLSREAILSAACELRPDPLPYPQATIARRAMACGFSITLPANLPHPVDAGVAALDEIDRLEERLSIYKDESDLSRLNATAAGRPVQLDTELYSLLRTARNLSRATGRAFDPAAGALVRAWGFFRGPRRVPSTIEIRAARENSGIHFIDFDDEQRTIAFRRPVEFNLGAFGKGYAIDRAIHRVWTQHHVRCALMQGGQSSIKAVGAPPDEPRGWQVQLMDPENEVRPLVRLSLRDRALGTSGDANRFFVHHGRRFGHVLDPRTGWPACGLAAASAIARHAAEADALSTAFYVLGVEATREFLKHRPDLGAILVLPKSQSAARRVIVLGAADAEVLS